MEDVFDLVEQLLGAAEAEGGDEDGAVVGQGAVDDGFEALLAVAAVAVETVAVGAFQDEDVGALRGLDRAQQWVAGCAEVAGEDDSVGVGASWVLHVAFDVGGAEQVAGALEADAAGGVVVVGQGVPGFEGDGVDVVVEQGDEAFDLGGVVGDAEAVGVFEDQGEELGGGFAADDRAAEAGGQEGGDAAYVVEVDVGDDEGLDAGGGESEWLGVGVDGCVGALFEAAVDEEAGLGG